MEGLDSSREERDEGVPRGPGGPPHHFMQKSHIWENLAALGFSLRRISVRLLKVSRTFAGRRAEAGFSPPQTEVCPTPPGLLGLSEQYCGLDWESQIRSQRCHRRLRN